MTYKGIHEILKKAFVIYVPLSLLTPLLMYQWRDNNRLILMDRANSYHITEYTSDQQLRQLYEYQIKQAVFAFLMRNPNGFDNRELLGAMFVGTARQEAQKVATRGSPMSFQTLMLCSLTSASALYAPA